MALYPPEEPAIRTQEDVNRAYKNGYKIGFKDGKQRTAAVGEESKTWVHATEWRGLTNEDIAVVLTGDASLGTRLDELTPSWIELVKAVEARLKEKNFS